MVDPQESRIDRHLPIPQIYDDLYSFLHCSPFLVFTEKKVKSCRQTCWRCHGVLPWRRQSALDGPGSDCLDAAHGALTPQGESAT